MDRALLILSLIALAACDSPRRGQTIRMAGCVEGRATACFCSDGRMGSQVCQADDQFSPCECTGTADDAGEEGDGSLRKDAETDDTGFPPSDAGSNDGGFDFDVGPEPDSGQRDAGDSGPRDTGPRDGGSDSGFDSGSDSGVDSGFDSGPRFDGGFADGGIPPFPDGGLAGLCQLLPELGLPCGTDAECNTILPIGLLFCEGGFCVEGCACDNGPICNTPTVCDPVSGRCL